MISRVVANSTVGLLLIALAGCTDLKPVQAELDGLKSQVSKLQADANAARASADAAARAASQASQSAQSAQSTASRALAAAQASQSSVDATNEKLDRMFKKRLSK